MVVHADSTGHLPKWIEAEVLHEGPSRVERKALEAARITAKVVFMVTSVSVIMVTSVSVLLRHEILSAALLASPNSGALLASKTSEANSADKPKLRQNK